MSKFTPKQGRVQIRLQRANSQVEIVISDTGKGIEPEVLPPRSSNASARATAAQPGNTADLVWDCRSCVISSSFMAAWSVMKLLPSIADIFDGALPAARDATVRLEFYVKLPPRKDTQRFAPGILPERGCDSASPRACSLNRPA